MLPSAIRQAIPRATRPSSTTALWASRIFSVELRGSFCAGYWARKSWSSRARQPVTVGEAMEVPHMVV